MALVRFGPGRWAPNMFFLPVAGDQYFSDGFRTTDQKKMTQLSQPPNRGKQPGCFFLGVFLQQLAFLPIPPPSALCPQVHKGCPQLQQIPNNGSLSQITTYIVGWLWYPIIQYVYLYSGPILLCFHKLLSSLGYTCQPTHLIDRGIMDQGLPAASFREGILFMQLWGASQRSLWWQLAATGREGGGFWSV